MPENSNLTRLLLLAISASASLGFAFFLVPTETGFTFLRLAGPYFLFFVFAAFLATLLMLVRTRTSMIGR